MSGFMKGVKPDNFLDRATEWHALCQGFFEVLCPWPPRHKAMTAKLRAEIEEEHHYYMLGRATGVIAWLIIAKIIQEVFF